LPDNFSADIKKINSLISLTCIFVTGCISGREAVGDAKKKPFLLPDYEYEKKTAIKALTMQNNNFFPIK